MADQKVISFLSDLGNDDESVGVCKAIILQQAPDVTIIDIGHNIAPFDVRAGALALTRAIQFLPSGIVLATIDPGSPKDQRYIAVELENSIFIGPDNGLLAPAAQLLGEPRRVHEITNPEYRIEAPGGVFAARDIMAPAAGVVASGVDISELGAAIPLEQLVPGMLQLSRHDEGGAFLGEVWSIDRFDNIQTNITPEELTTAGLRVGDTAVVRVGQNDFMVKFVERFADLAKGQLGLLVDSTGMLSIFKNLDFAAKELNVSEGSEIIILPQGTSVTGRDVTVENIQAMNSMSSLDQAPAPIAPQAQSEALPVAPIAPSSFPENQMPVAPSMPNSEPVFPSAQFGEVETAPLHPLDAPMTPVNEEFPASLPEVQLPPYLQDVQTPVHPLDAPMQAPSVPEPSSNDSFAVTPPMPSASDFLQSPDAFVAPQENQSFVAPDPLAAFPAPGSQDHVAPGYLPGTQPSVEPIAESNPIPVAPQDDAQAFSGSVAPVNNEGFPSYGENPQSVNPFVQDIPQDIQATSPFVQSPVQNDAPVEPVAPIEPVSAPSSFVAPTPAPAPAPVPQEMPSYLAPEIQAVEPVAPVAPVAPQAPPADQIPASGNVFDLFKIDEGEEGKDDPFSSDK